VNPKHLSTLEFPKILSRLADYASFSAGQEQARALAPATDPREISRRLETTSEARELLELKPGATLGGAHDVRPRVEAAQRGLVLPPSELLEVRDTLTSARSLYRTLIRLEDQFPRLADIAARIQPCPQLVEEIDRCLDERGEVRDSASAELARIRREVQIAHDRIKDKLQHIIQKPRSATFLQDSLITQREGRYVIPLRAEFKGRIRGVTHDVSASGATLFVEPLSVVDLNNTWRELQLAEKQEVERILASLSDLVADRAAEIEWTVEALADLDLAFAQAKYADAIDAAAPELVLPRAGGEEGGGGSALRFLGARHPLLDPEMVVPIDVLLDDESHVLVITGPNTGGKTVTLKTVGLLALMAQSGLHLPVESGSAFSPFETIYADIGDEQSIEQNLSTFSSHLTNILSFLDRADERSLVLLDELGAGTDPAEGAALAHALLDHFRQCGATTFVATHYPELKTYAQLTPGVCNACVEFDPDTLAPTYKLTIGLPGRSNAFAIARRLGLPRDIAEAAREMVSPDDLHAEDMLADIHRLRVQEAQARDKAEGARSEVEKLTRDLRERLAGIEQERREVLEQAREEAAEELEMLGQEVRALRRRLQTANVFRRARGQDAVPLETVAEIEEEIEVLEEDLPQPEELEPLPFPEQESAHPIHPGDTVRVRPLDAKGRVIEIDDEEAEVQVGPARTRVRRRDLELIAATPQEPPAPSADTTARIFSAASPGERLDLRGCTVDQALTQVDRRLDAAFRAGLPWVRIIHGKGTGALRQAVRDFLDDYPLVSAYEGGGVRGGGEGVTVVKLAQ